MMVKRVFIIDIDKCIRCYACVVACKQENDLPMGIMLPEIITVGPRKLNEELHMDFVPVICLHCEEPYCAQVCPVNIIVKGEDGEVLIKDLDRCIGCEQCVYACPYGCIKFNDDKKIPVKCDLCYSLVNYGLQPSCVKHCIGGALQFMEEAVAIKISDGRHKAGTRKVWYVSSKWELSL